MCGCLQCRWEDGLSPIVSLLEAGCRNQTAICAAEAIANLVSHNGINQDAVADGIGVEALVNVMSAALEALAGDLHAAQVVEYRYAYRTHVQLCGLACSLLGFRKA